VIEGRRPEDAPEPALPFASTRTLIFRIRSGDESAREELFRRMLPGLSRWAHGRLPRHTRGLADTDDLVQISLARALGRIDDFDPRRQGAFLAYLHQILLNCIREEIRRANRRREDQGLPEELPEDRPSILDRALGAGTVASYEAALPNLPEDQQQAVILRIEFGFSHRDIATALGRPSADAARMLVSRGLLRLSELMDAGRA
jgi:RNA polymerase sigma-70 factor (ECF subfamily)